jgi:hypothetical protein
MEYKIKINETELYFKLNNMEYILEKEIFNFIELDELYNIIDIKTGNKYNNFINNKNNNYIIIGKKTPYIYYINKQMIQNKYLILIIINNKIHTLITNDLEIELNIKLTPQILDYNYTIYIKQSNNLIDKLISLFLLNSRPYIIYDILPNISNNYLILQDIMIFNIDQLDDIIKKIIDSNNYNMSYLSKNKECYFVNNNVANLDTIDETYINCICPWRNKINIIKTIIPPLVITNINNIFIQNQDYPNIIFDENYEAYEAYENLLYINDSNYIYYNFITQLIYQKYFIDNNSIGKYLIPKYKIADLERTNIATKLKFKMYPFVNIELCNNSYITFIANKNINKDIILNNIISYI